MKERACGGNSLGTSSFNCVLVFHCYVTNDHKFNSLKQQIFYYPSVSVSQDTRHGLPGFSAPGSCRAVPKVLAGVEENVKLSPLLSTCGYWGNSFP